MLNKFEFEGSVRSSPILLNSSLTGNSFVKFTIRNDPDLPWSVIRKYIESKGNGQGDVNYGQVYMDCFLQYNDKDNGNVGKYALENVHKYDVIRAVGKIRSGRKPVKEETDEFRSNWVYGDYLYVRIAEIEVIKAAPALKPKSYKFITEDYRPKDNSKYNGIKSCDQYVSDEDIIFDI